MIRMQGHAREQVIGSSYISVSRKPTRNGSSEAIHLFKGAGVVRIGAGNGSNKSSRDRADFHLGSLHIRPSGRPERHELRSANRLRVPAFELCSCSGERVAELLMTVACFLQDSVEAPIARSIWLSLPFSGPTFIWTACRWRKIHLVPEDVESGCWDGPADVTSEYWSRSPGCWSCIQYSI